MYIYAVSKARQKHSDSDNFGVYDDDQYDTTTLIDDYDND